MATTAKPPPATPLTVPKPTPNIPSTLPRLAPITLSYLQTISQSTGPTTTSTTSTSSPSPHHTSQRQRQPLSSAQLNELASPPHDNQFLKYMSSAASSAAKPTGEIDLGFPLSSYFINSSHNTYLTGNQLYGEASTAPYTNALLHGCRCIEIDVWDGEPKQPPSDDDAKEEKKHGFRSHVHQAISSVRHGKDELASTLKSEAEKEDSLDAPTPWTSYSTTARAEPRVLHGHTLTKEVSFRDVCSAIKDAAFVNSDLPVIVSLEVHASPPQQDIMVEIMKFTFKHHLVNVPTHPVSSLPSPAELRSKILIKVKYVDPKKAAAKVKAANAPKSVEKFSRNQPATSLSSSSSEEEILPGEHASGDKKKKKKKSSIIPSLSELGVYTRSYHFSNLTSPDAEDPTHVFSLSEKKLMEVHESLGPTLFSHNRHFLMRAFPSGLRVRSDNLDPSVFWRTGVQMVALNWQRWDEGMMLNEAMFVGSGGWVLKPKAYLAGRSPANTEGKSQESQAEAVTHKTLDLEIEIFAGQDIPLPVGDTKTESFHPYVKCELHVEKPAERTGKPIEGGGKTKEGEYKYQTRTTKGVDPDFSGEKATFRGIPGIVEELSFIRFKIQDDEIGKDDLAAWACIRLDRLCDGYRFVHLLDAAGNPGNGVLLVHIQKTLI